MTRDLRMILIALIVFVITLGSLLLYQHMTHSKVSRGVPKVMQKKAPNTDPRDAKPL